MTDAFFDGFDDARMDLGHVTLRVRRAGTGTPLILLHGYPQNGACWHRVAPALAERHDVIVPDLRGYGASDAPPGDAAHDTYSKRAMAADVAALMDALGIDAAHVMGHDRGARAAYRLALDAPERVRRLALLEILPTAEYWRAMDAEFAMAVYHWCFLAQPHPMPERLIAGDPEGYVRHTLAAWTAPKDLSPFAPEALAAYLAQAREPARIHAMCSDYRAGATTDRAHDEADRAAGARIHAPLACLFARTGFPARTGDPAAVWRRWAREVTTATCASGHFVAEEAPDAVLDLAAAHFA